MTGWVRDAGHRLRLLARTPAATAVVVLSRALGIGANTAIFLKQIYPALPDPTRSGSRARYGPLVRARQHRRPSRSESSNVLGSE